MSRSDDPEARRRAAVHTKLADAIEARTTREDADFQAASQGEPDGDD